MADPAKSIQGAPELKLADHSRSSTAWERFRWLVEFIDSKVFASLTPTQQTIAMIYYRRANFESWQAYPSATSLADDSGRSEAAAKKARKALVELGILRLVNKGGGRSAGVYELMPAESWQHLESGSCQTADRGVFETYPQGCSKRTPRGVRNVPLNETIETDKINNVVAVADDWPEAEETLFGMLEAGELLADRGFKMRDAKKLTGRFGADRIQQAIAQADWLQSQNRIKSSYRGYVVAFLDQDFQVDTRVGQAERQRQRDTTAQQRAADKAAEDQRQTDDLAAERQESERTWAALSIEEKKRLRLIVIQTLPKWMQDKSIDSPAIKPLIIKQAKDFKCRN